MKVWKLAAFMVVVMMVGAATCQPPPPPPTDAEVQANTPSPDKYVLTFESGTVDAAGNQSAPLVTGQIASDGPGKPWHPVGSTTEGLSATDTTPVLVPSAEGGFTIAPQSAGTEAFNGNTGNCGSLAVVCRSWAKITIGRGDLCLFGHCAMRAWANISLVWRHFCSYAYGCLSIGDAAGKIFPTSGSSNSYFRDAGCPPDGHSCSYPGDSVQNYNWNGWANGGFHYAASMEGHVEIAGVGNARTAPWLTIRGHYDGTYSGDGGWN